jgi:hypothetical protein
LEIYPFADLTGETVVEIDFGSFGSIHEKTGKLKIESSGARKAPSAQAPIEATTAFPVGRRSVKGRGPDFWRDEAQISGI